MKPALALSALFIFGCAHNPPPTREDIAEKITSQPIPNCKKGHNTALANGAVTIKTGDTVCFKVKVQDDQIVPITVVSRADSDDTIIVRLGKEGRNTFLRIQNPLDVFFGYQAQFLRRGQSWPEHTSTCPVAPHILGIELWPYAIDELRIEKFMAIPKSAEIKCQ